MAVAVYDDTREILIGNLLTGEIYAIIPAGSASWNVVHRKAGKVEAAFLVTDDLLEAYPDLTVQMREWRSFIGIRMAATGRILEAGPVTGWGFDSTDDTLRVTGAGLLEYFKHRLLVEAKRTADTSKALVWDQWSLGTIARNIVQTSMGVTGGGLPIVLPDTVKGTNTRTYWGYEFGVIADRLTQIMEVDGGPDIMFQPRMVPGSATKIQWQMRVGSPLLSQEGDDWIFTMGVPDTPVLSYTVDSDGADMSFRTFAVGSGQNEDALVAQYANWSMIDGYGYPLLENKVTESSVEEMDTLTGWAKGDVESNRAPWRTWTFTLDPGASPQLGE